MKKHEDIYRHLRQIVSDLKPGGVLPSVREIMGTCSVSQVTVTRAMTHLKKEGMIVSRIGEGTFKAGAATAADRQAATTHRLSMFVPDYPSTFSSSVQAGFKTFFSSAGCDFRIFCYDCHAPRITRSMIKGNVDGVIVFAGTDFEVDSIAALQRLGLPALIVNLIPGGLSLDAVCTDNEFGGALAADWMLSHGHRKTAVLLSQPHGPTQEQRRIGFERRMRLAGIEHVNVIDCRTRNGQDSTESSYHQFRERCQAGGMDFTALFCDSDLGAFGVIKACHEMDIALPGQLSIIGFDNLPEGKYFSPSLSSIDQNVAAWAEEAGRILRQRFCDGGGEAIQTQIRPFLIIRDSVKVISP